MPVAGVVVEASDGRVTHRRLTYADGRFIFDPLQPGNWTVRVLGPLPPGYALATAARPIAVGAGEEIDASIRLSPEQTIQRRIPSDRDTTIRSLGFRPGGSK
jgi:hypothetical protein